MTTTLQLTSSEEPVAPLVALRTVDLGKRSQPRLERLATFLEHLGWRFQMPQKNMIAAEQRNDQGK